jgi:Tfp pilus assembly protein PilF
MTALRYKILLLVGIMILTGCALRSGKDQPIDRPFQSAAGDKLLAKGVESYEEGEYERAAKNLQDAINAGLSRKIDSAKAHKYLAFIACGANNIPKCRDEFRKAFENDPNFTLDAAETGHPVWGPVYRGVREQR